MIETLLYNRLRVIGSNVYPLVAPKNYATPAIVYNRVGMDPTRDLSEDAQSEGWMDFQVDVYSLTLLEATQVAQQITNNLKTWRSQDVRAAVWTAEEHSVDDTTDVSLYRVRLAFTFYVGEL